MSCLTDGILRAKLDGELNEAELREVEGHLASCSGCRQRADSMASQGRRVDQLLSTLAPLPNQTAPDAAVAFMHFKAQQRPAEAKASSLLGRIFSARLAPAWGGVVALFLVGACFSFAPARGWAQKILAMLRVQKIAVVPVDLTSFDGRNDSGAAKMIGQMISDNVVVTLKPGEPPLVSSAEEASQLAGFKVRLLGARADAPRIRVQGEQAFHMTLDRDRLQAIAEEVGRPDLTLPDSVDGATIAVHIPKTVFASYGQCKDPESRSKAEPQGDSEPQPPQGDSSDCVFLAQVPSPTVSVPPNLNLAQVAEAGLQLAGMSAAEARSFSDSVDWTSTLVIPLPRHAASYQTVDVEGVPGTLIDMPARGRRRQVAYTLLWVKNGIIYTLAGTGSPDQAVPLAESLD
jgi:hypothetical protein